MVNPCNRYFFGAFFAKICTNFIIKKIWAKIECFSDGFGYRYKRILPDCSVFYTGATQIEKILKNVFEVFGGFPGKIVVRTRRLLQPCNGRYTKFWHILAKQTTKTADLRNTIRAQVATSVKYAKHTQNHPYAQSIQPKLDFLHTFAHTTTTTFAVTPQQMHFFNKNAIKNEKNTCIRI